MKSHPLVACGLVLQLAMALPAAGDVLYWTYVPRGAETGLFASIVRGPDYGYAAQAAPFTVPAHSSLSDIEFEVYDLSGVASKVAVSIATSGADNTPDEEIFLGNFAPLLESPFDGNSNLAALTLQKPFDLSANTIYWLVLRPTDGTTSAGWIESPVSGSSLSDDGSNTWNTAGHSLGFSILGSTVAPLGIDSVPEPSALTLLGVSAVGFLAIRRRTNEGTAAGATHDN